MGPPLGPGVLLERSWCLLKRSRDALDGSWRLLAAPRALPGCFRGASGGLLTLSWGLLEPRDLILEPFSFRKAFLLLAFGATATQTATASWSLALEALDQGSWALALESWALARGSLALARGVMGFSSGVLAFDSGASALRSWSLALGSWALALGPSAVSLALGL